jgi:hypothetical protein
MNRTGPVEVLAATARRLRVPRDLREDGIQTGWLSIVVRGDCSGVELVMKDFCERWKSDGVTGRRDRLAGGVGEILSASDPGVRAWLGVNAGGYVVVPDPEQAAGGYVATGRPCGRPPKRAPAGAPGKLLKAAGIHPFRGGMAELRGLVRGGREGRDPRLVKAVLGCQAWGAAELARLLGCSRQAVNDILREHRAA